ncbi:hypothetical protein QCA50_017407 [Cerrena zonata]|uniref:CFEM domain-containing protein n=1 Tax=Cerrena zonata TaxID=2478898 RepID=A0AAW0FG05_9APHY
MFKFTLSAFLVASVAKAVNYETYPSVAHTASFDGFADPIYDKVPSCAQKCLRDTVSDAEDTVCPYWDTGCLCVMESFNDAQVSCLVDACSGTDINSFTSLATSLCSSAGVGSPYWYIASSDSSLLASAAAKTTVDSESSATSAAASAAASAEATQAVSSTEAEAASSAPPVTSSSVAETSAPADNGSSAEAPAESSAVESDSLVESLSSNEGENSSSSSAESTSSESSPAVEQANMAPSKAPISILITLAVSF